MQTTEPPDPRTPLTLVVVYAKQAVDVLHATGLQGADRRAQLDTLLRGMVAQGEAALTAQVGNLQWLSDALDTSAVSQAKATEKLEGLTGTRDPVVWADYVEALALQVIGQGPTA